MAKKTIKDLKESLSKLKSVTDWHDVTPNGIYHIPPIATLERREIMILEKDAEKATYQRIGDKEKKERTMHKTSAFAKFLVKRKQF